MAEVMDVVTHAASAGGGGLTVGYIAKVLIQNWIKRHDETVKDFKDVNGEVAEALKNLLVGQTRIEEQIKTLQKNQDRALDTDRNVAILGKQVEDMQKNLNGLGMKVRNLKP